MEFNSSVPDTVDWVPLDEARVYVWLVWVTLSGLLGQADKSGASRPGTNG